MGQKEHELGQGDVEQPIADFMKILHVKGVGQSGLLSAGVEGVFDERPARGGSFKVGQVKTGVAWDGRNLHGDRSTGGVHSRDIALRIWFG